MSFFARLKAIFSAWTSQALDDLEDPRTSLDHSLTRLQASLRQISDSLVEVSTARRNLETQRTQLETAIAKYKTQAHDALAVNREDLAARALERKAAARERLESLQANIESLNAQVESLKTSQASLRQKIDLFQGKKEELKAVYDSSRAQLQVKEAVSGISKDLSDVGHAIERAEARIRGMQARVEAIDELVASGVLDEALTPGDDIDRELARLSRTTVVEKELEQLKAKLQADPSELALNELKGQNLAV
jgi:phage shock protein A